MSVEFWKSYNNVFVPVCTAFCILCKRSLMVFVTEYYDCELILGFSHIGFSVLIFLTFRSSFVTFSFCGD